MSNVIDANCWCFYVDEKLREISEIGTHVFSTAQRCGGVLLDDGGHARQQYVDMRKPYAEQLFDIWAEEATTSGHLKIVDLSGKPNLYRELTDLGLPKKEHIFFRLAVHGNAGFLVSADSDFFDPDKKYAGEAEKLALLQGGRGPVCRHMRKRYGVTICCPQTFVEMLEELVADQDNEPQ